MNGDAKCPQHTVVHPMYVSYSSIPTSASATMLSNKHHQTQISNHLQANNTLSHASYHHADHQEQTFNKCNNNNNNNNSKSSNSNNFNYISHSHSNSNSNSNTFLIHTNGSGNNFNHASSSSNSYNKKAYHNSNYNSYNSNNQTPNASRNNTFNRIQLYSPRTNKIPAHSSILPAALAKQFYDDSTAKADQLYTHSNRRQFVDAAIAYQQHVANTPSTPYNSTHATTTPSLSYASLQNSNINLSSAMGAATTPLSNSNYSLTNSMSNNYLNNSLNNNYQQQQPPIHAMGTGGSARFARINSKPRPSKSTSYSSFKSGTATLAGVSSTLNNVNAVSCRPDIKYMQLSHDIRHARHINEGPEDDNFSLHNFKGDEGLTYVPFQSPTPSAIFQQASSNNNNNSINNSNNNISASYASIISPMTPNNNSHNSHASIVDNVNNNSVILSNTSFQPLNNNEILLENGAVLYPARAKTDINMQPVFNVATRALQQQNVLPYYTASTFQRAYPTPARPTNIPLPSIPDNTQCFNTPLSPSDVTPPPPPPPAPRPHIFQPRSGHAPYPDLSPEVTEKYAMPTQYVPRSPVAARIARRQRQQQERMAHANAAHNFCDQIRDAPPGYVDTGFSIVRAKSDERITGTDNTTNVALVNVDAAPHVNRRSGRRDARARPRSYCNSLVGGEGVVRCNIAADREMSIKNIN